MKITREEVRRILGDISDHMVVEILATGATETDLQEAAAHLAQETDVMGELERPLTGRALQIYTLVRSLDERWEEERDA
ncbi:hypothetical protein [Acidimangrovimonas pyrenivorans]|uniref:Uncharacterized protein n=1 Tax=Acidimangrovimonas pyrenivorans TaxID=2030798 RepID=A0ABV7AGY8_9RHOB